MRFIYFSVLLFPEGFRCHSASTSVTAQFQPMSDDHGQVHRSLARILNVSALLQISGREDLRHFSVRSGAKRQGPLQGLRCIFGSCLSYKSSLRLTGSQSICQTLQLERRTSLILCRLVTVSVTFTANFDIFIGILEFLLTSLRKKYCFTN